MLLGRLISLRPQSASLPRRALGEKRGGYVSPAPMSTTLRAYSSVSGIGGVSGRGVVSATVCASVERGGPFVLLIPTQAQATLLPHRARCEGRAMLRGEKKKKRRRRRMMTMKKISAWRRLGERLCVHQVRPTRSPHTPPSPPLGASRCPSRRPDPRLSPLRAKATPLRWHNRFTLNRSGSSSWLPCGRCENGPCTHTCELFSPASNRPVNSTLRIRWAGYLRSIPTTAMSSLSSPDRSADERAVEHRPPGYRIGLHTRGEQNRPVERRPPCYRFGL
jgi:hypothetical protein